MKKLVCLGIGVLAAVIAKASTVESSNVFGVLKVISNKAETVLCVPWVGVGTTGSALKASDVVLTSNLQPGDTLSAFNNDKFETWELDDNKAWSQVGSYTYTGDQITTPDATVDANTVAVAKGGAFILCRNGSNRDLTQPIYLSGQYSSDPVSTTILGNTKKSVITFFAPPTAAPVNLNSLSPASGSGAFAEGDVIMVDFDTQFKYNGTAWGKISESKSTMTIDGKSVTVTSVSVDTTQATIDAGRAGWYIRKPTSAANVVINW